MTPRVEALVAALSAAIATAKAVLTFVRSLLP